MLKSETLHIPGSDFNCALNTYNAHFLPINERNCMRMFAETIGKLFIIHDVVPLRHGYD